MESFAILLAIAVVGFLLIAPALGIAAYIRSGRLRDEVARLRRQTEGLTLQIDDLRKSGAAARAQEEGPRAPEQEAPPEAVFAPADEPSPAPPPRPATAAPTAAPPPAAAEPVAPYVREQPKVGRNQPCPCGSGKKYKQCHGRLS